jgi:predicted helicase
MSGQYANDYLNKLVKKFQTGHAGEYAHRPALEDFFEKVSGFNVVNEPRRSEYGAPDFVFLKGKITIAYAEAKDIGVSLDEIEKGEQMSRYYGYSDLILTDYLEFRFFRNGQKYCEPVKIGEVKDGIIRPLENNFSLAEETIRDFTQGAKEPIHSGEHLAKIMGGKARRIRDNVRHFLAIKSDKNAELIRVYETVKKLLVHDLTADSFADMYAQTLVYGLFIARYNDETPENFSRREARDLVPISIPFLRHFFDHIVGPDFDERLENIVNELCEVFSLVDVKELMKQYFKNDLWGQTHSGPDPVIHFYEDFLHEYDSALRKKIGAYYTPLPVVWFIIRSVDYLLEKEFGLAAGLADTAKLANGVHRVQILDPAVGTGTFISKIIRIIYERLLKGGQKGRWPAYVHHDLLPRLHGFELMMAPYTIAHLKLSLAFKETGFGIFHRRLGIYLTNSLEESAIQESLFTGFGFAQSIADESKEAAVIKNKTPIMVIVGNPPYSVSSSNKGEWIQNLIKDYKTGLGERKINLDDDYIKFIRFAEHFIEKNKSGIVAMITNNSYLDGITHRQMRYHLLETFDDIYILNLHGDAKKKETAPDGGKDENVFNIMQGVAISIFVRRASKKKGLGEVHYADIYGKREFKFKFLNESKLPTIKWKKLDYTKPYYFFVPKDFEAEEEYRKGFGVNELFVNYNSGIQTKNDDLTINLTKSEINKIVEDFLNSSLLELKQKYNVDDSMVWKASEAQADLKKSDYVVSSILYRPFDIRYTAITPRSSGFLARPRIKTSKHMLSENCALLFSRSIPEQLEFSEIFLCNNPADLHAAAGQTYCGPLYLYLDDGSRVANFKKEIVAEIEKIVGKVEPENIFDYIYAVLHSPSYREKYKEFLKIDFPRVPYPKDKKQFFTLAKLGEELRKLHLLESSAVEKFITTYPVGGTNIVEKVIYNGDKVYINKEQYFGGVPEAVWNFYIGGYQPAQKWLKDRKSRELTNADIEHYQKIVVALKETGRVMGEIEKVIKNIL